MPCRLGHITFVKFTNKKLQKVLSHASKVVLLVLLVAMVFSPLVQTAPKASAQQGSCTPGDPACGTAPGVAPLPANPKDYATPPDDFGCGISTKLDAGICLSNVVYVFTVGLGSGLAYMGAFILDTTVSLSLNSAAYALTFLSAGWTTARDLANMAFILILVYIAFKIMFRAETSRTMQMLAWVIFIALIINFSFFFTRVVIDAGNILAVQFYNSISGPNGQPAPTLADTFGKATQSGGLAGGAASGASTVTSYFGNDSTLKNTKDLTASIMNALNIQELFNQKSFESFRNGSGFMSKIIILSTLYIGIGAAYFILAAMFLAVGIKFLFRIVVLWFLIIASPLAFICKAVPNDKVRIWYDEWQNALVMHAFYPAFFLFIFFFISTVMAGLNTTNGLLGGLANDLSVLAGNQNLSGTIYIVSAMANVGIRLGFVIAMLYIALKASELMSVKGAGMAQKATTFAFGSAGRMVSAPIGFAGRNTVGRLVGKPLMNVSATAGTRALQGSNWASRGGWRTLAAGTGAVGNKLGKATYDPRNSRGASVLKKVAEKVTGPTINAGKPPEGGFIAGAKARADRIKQEQAARSIIKRDKENKEMIKELAEKGAAHDKLEKDSKVRTLSAAEVAEKDTLKKEITSMANTLNSLGKREIETFKAEELEKVLSHAKEGVIKKVEDSDKFKEEEKSGIRKQHTEQMALKEQTQAAETVIKEQARTQQKTQELGKESLGEIRQITAELKHLREDLQQNGGVSHRSLPSILNLTTSGQTISQATLRSAQDEINAELVVTHTQFRNATTNDERETKRHAMSQLKEAKDQITKLRGHLKNVPENAGDAAGAQEYKVA